jgi:hypothetical protein
MRVGGNLLERRHGRKLAASLLGEGAAYENKKNRAEQNAQPGILTRSLEQKLQRELNQARVADCRRNLSEIRGL